MSSRRHKQGYTLVELLVVLAMVGVLAGMAMPMAEMTVQRERERELKRNLWELRDAIDAYRRARETGAIAAPPGTSLYPPSLEALTRAWPDARQDHQGQMLRFLRQVPRDPFSDSTLPATQTWGLRSFQSEADRPQAGDDVYDVFTTSTRIGLNGMPLQQW